MNVLVDTSVWVDYFQSGNSTLQAILEQDIALTHPMVLGELACGTPPAPRNQTLSGIGYLQTTQQASLSEVMAFIEREKLYGLGCGLIDLMLLASTLITPNAKLWTLDKRLAEVAARFGVAYSPLRH